LASHVGLHPAKRTTKSPHSLQIHAPASLYSSFFSKSILPARSRTDSVRRWRLRRAALRAFAHLARPITAMRDSVRGHCGVLAIVTAGARQRPSPCIFPVSVSTMHGVGTDCGGMTAGAPHDGRLCCLSNFERGGLPGRLCLPTLGYAACKTTSSFRMIGPCQGHPHSVRPPFSWCLCQPPTRRGDPTYAPSRPHSSP